jgi:hypothetical protein
MKNCMDKNGVELSAGDAVDVGKPKANDLHQNAFSGQIIRLNFIEGYASVVDEDGEIFDVDFDNIEVC